MFDSVNYFFLISILERYGFGDDIIKWIEKLLKNQESCILNGGKTTRYFKLERGTQEGDPISEYLFILVLEIAFIFIKTNNNIEGLNIFNHNFLYTAYADDTTFFIKNVNSATEIIKMFDYFPLFSGLNINKTKCKIAGIGVLKGVKVLLILLINLKNDVIKILGICYSLR